MRISIISNKLLSAVVKMANEQMGIVTGAQFNMLKHNAYSMDSEDVLLQKYKGCGSGWCEIDEKGNIVDFKYFAEGLADVEKSKRELYFNVNKKDFMQVGQTQQNADMLDFQAHHLEPTLLPDGNIRVVVNLSNCAMYRF